MKWRRRFEVVALGTSGSAISQRSVISEHRSERDAREAAGLERRRLEVIRAEEAASWSILVVRGDEVLHEERPFDGHREDAPVPPLTALHIRQAETPPVEPPAAAAEDEADPTPTGSLPALPGVPGVPATADAHDVDDADDVHEASDAGDTPVAEPVAGPPSPTAPETHAAGGDEDAPSAGTAPAAVPEFDSAPEFDARRHDEDEDGATGRVTRPSAADDAGPRSPSEPGSRRDADSSPSGPVPDDIIRRFEESIARERARNARR